MLKKRNLKKIARAHTIFSVTFFAIYIALSVIYSPEFLFSDIRGKFRALADETIVLVAKVLGPPVVPVVSGEASCVNGSLSISLDWPDDENAETFNIDRDDLPLITDLTSSHYEDAAVSVNNAYVYTVTAIGPMGPGSAVSEPVTIATPAECNVPAPAGTLSITSVESQSVESYNGDIRIESTKPTFSGITNIPNAIINITIHSSMVIFGQTTANANGYWSWQSPVEISKGPHTISLIEENPNNPAEIISETLDFIIVNVNDKQSDNDKHHNKKYAASSTTPRITQTRQPNIALPNERPLDFSLTLENDSLFQGGQLAPTIHIDKLDRRFDGTLAKITYRISDAKRNEAYTLSSEEKIAEGTTLSKNIPLPDYLEAGDYRLQTEILLDGYVISKEITFSVKLRPILSLGGGIVLTYPEILSNLGTFALLLLLLLLIWTSLFYREYWLYLHAFRHITEKSLERIGLISIQNRKGVFK